MKRIQHSYDKFTGTTEEIFYDEENRKIHMVRSQDVEHQLAMNKIQYNQRKHAGYGDSEGLHKVATIPTMVIEKWLREDGFNWFRSTDAERRRKLNDADNRDLLVRKGRL